MGEDRGRGGGGSGGSWEALIGGRLRRRRRRPATRGGGKKNLNRHRREVGKGAGDRRLHLAWGQEERRRGFQAGEEAMEVGGSGRSRWRILSTREPSKEGMGKGGNGDKLPYLDGTFLDVPKPHRPEEKLPEEPDVDAEPSFNQKKQLQQLEPSEDDGGPAGGRLAGGDGERWHPTRGKAAAEEAAVAGSSEEAMGGKKRQCWWGI